MLESEVTPQNKHTERKRKRYHTSNTAYISNSTIILGYMRTSEEGVRNPYEMNQEIIMNKVRRIFTSLGNYILIK